MDCERKVKRFDPAKGVWVDQTCGNPTVFALEDLRTGQARILCLRCTIQECLLRMMDTVFKPDTKPDTPQGVTI